MKYSSKQSEQRLSVKSQVQTLNNFQNLPYDLFICENLILYITLQLFYKTKKEFTEIYANFFKENLPGLIKIKDLKRKFNSIFIFEYFPKFWI
ncbi:hypothetical protein BpHYR1_032049 [Brachionus plicatilis]|uniref:Uncharacterized protein n=1 Tax=Brachionus plicatilis TaxID=10195 RepID=A0A3M7S0J3_BRAPC|nr:hypothetical protein BpHYR1_032049 [Brachionus plicatilis]